MTTPVVSVVLLTYNHEQYIRQAIESVLTQVTDFPVELIISEDCSTDSTRSIVLEYAARHADRVAVLLSSRNQNDNEVLMRAFERARGDFVAYLDGDDYWTSPHKLQRQADLLRARPELSGCVHAVDVVDGAGRFRRRAGGGRETFTTADLLGHNPIHSPSVMLRRSALEPLPVWLMDAPCTDWPLYLLAAEVGPIAHLDESLAAYREHAGGLWSGAEASAQHLMTLAVYEAVLPHVSNGFRRQVRQYEAGWWLQLARTYGIEGRTREAAGALLRSVLLAPFRPKHTTRPHRSLDRTRLAVRALCRSVRPIRDRS